MGAFDGIRIPYDKGYPTTGFKNDYEYFPTQTAFRFFEGFGIKQLKELYNTAVSLDRDMVYVPRERRDAGQIGLNTWYVKVLIDRYESTHVD